MKRPTRHTDTPSTPPVKGKEKAPAATTQPVQPSWNEPLRTLFFALALALVFRSFFFEPFHIPSGSMKDGLLIGDYLFVSKYAYGYSRYSFPFSLPLFDGRVGTDARPQRGDVVVFRLPANPKIDFIKRVIGLPGDTVQMIGGVLHINGLPVSLERTDDFTDRLEDGTIADITRYRETLPGGVVHTVLDANPQSPTDDTLLFTVPPKHYFMMGDNRDHSMDSRFNEEIGYIPEQYIVGRAERIFFSVDDRTQMWKIWDWPWALRTERTLQAIR